jgi:predicted amidophosphoribosyltransferase
MAARRRLAELAGGLTGLAGGLSELVLPSPCVGCGAERVPLRYGTCAQCVAALEALSPLPTAPVPVPPGMPPCVAMGPYADVLRGALLAYKEKGRHGLARPLGALLATAVADVAIRGGATPDGNGRAGAQAGGVGNSPGGVPLLVLPVPSTARAARERHGDHLARLVAHTVRRLRSAGWQARVVRPLRASPRPDSAALDAAERAAVAVSSLRIRSSRIGLLQRCVTLGGMLVVVDDIVTTGSTLAAVSGRLEGVNVQVTGAAVVAATQRRNGPSNGSPGLAPVGTDWANRRESVPRTRGDGRASAR